MPFLRGSLGFERFSVAGFDSQKFGQDHVEILANHAAGKNETIAAETAIVGFLGGDHLFDQDFDLGKNVINDAVHCSVRIDTNQIPAAIRAAWLQMELAGATRDSPTGKPTKAQRKEAKEAVEQRCEAEVATGKYRKLKQFPLLWDVQHEQLYFGGTAGPASAICMDLVERAFEVELRHIGAGSIATDWAIENECFGELDDLMPEKFVAEHTFHNLAWSNEHSQSPDFLGNEFLLWLWWTLENESDTIVLPDESEVTLMMNKTLTLECPIADSGKETITSESPVKLPEAMQAIRTGKLPRKSGLAVVRHDRAFDLVLAAESFGISGAKIHLDDDEDFDDEDRIDAIRLMSETVDLTFHAFLAKRCDAEEWGETRDAIGRWLTGEEMARQKAA